MIDEIRGNVFCGGLGAVLMARICSPDGSITIPDDILGVYYEIYDADSGEYANSFGPTEVTHKGVFLDRAVTDSPWTQDEVGYNFRHDIPSTEFGDMRVGRKYDVRYEVVTFDHPTFYFKFVVTCVDKEDAMPNFVEDNGMIDGEYTGRWEGHELRVDYFGSVREVYTKIGIRGLNVPVRLNIVDGKVVEKGIQSVRGLE